MGEGSCFWDEQRQRAVSEKQLSGNSFVVGRDERIRLKHRFFGDADKLTKRRV